jgi:hypothetical protein
VHRDSEEEVEGQLVAVSEKRDSAYRIEAAHDLVWIPGDSAVGERGQ